MNLFGDALTLPLLKNFDSITQFMHANRKHFFYLKVSAIDNRTKRDFFINLFKQYGAYSHGIDKLIDLLIHDKRLILIADILHEICAIYMKNNGIAEWRITSTHELTQPEKDILMQFLSRKTHDHIIPTYLIDSTLIAGLRLHSSTYLWEHSVKAQLNALKRTYKGYYGN
jgi:ATP synthase F1 delta subunit